MVSNWTWASAALTSTGRSVVSRRAGSAPASAMQSATACGGGGTKAALPGRVPPIQFWLRRNSPGSLSLPRPLGEQLGVHLADQARCTAGSPPRSRARPCSRAAT